MSGDLAVHWAPYPVTYVTDFLPVLVAGGTEWGDAAVVYRQKSDEEGVYSMSYVIHIWDQPTPATWAEAARFWRGW